MSNKLTEDKIYNKTKERRVFALPGIESLSKFTQHDLFFYKDFLQKSETYFFWDLERWWVSCTRTCVESWDCRWLAAKS